jgi:FO synthase
MTLARLFDDVRPEVARLLESALDGRELAPADGALLLRTQGADFQALLRAADRARAADKGDDVTYVVNRNINFTNVCYVGCTYCGFSRHSDDPDAYDRSMQEILAKCRDAVVRGATEVCIQGGIHPQKTHDHYREILITIKRELPDLHIHAFSPEEIDFGQKQSGMPLDEYLRWLMEAGLDTMPGTAAEILDDSLRRVIAPRKLMTARWVEIIRTAHSVGLPSTSTLMYGHIEEPEHVANHLALLRDIQKDTGGFTEFVPLGFIHDQNRLFQHMQARPGAAMAEDLRTLAVARLMLRPWIRNVQISWVKMGPKLGQMGLLAGANDFGGTLMEESISRESGASFGENLPAEEIRALVRGVGRIPVERSTKYEVLRRFENPALDPPSLEPRAQREIHGPGRFRGGVRRELELAGVKAAAS